jgi:hypothetical protein
VELHRKIAAMLDHSELQDLADYLSRTTRLAPGEAQRVVQEVIGYLQETPDAYVRRRHRALQAQGLPNEAIYACLAAELSSWRFRAPALSQRQIRRMIYG